MAASTLGYQTLVVSNSPHSLVPEIARGISVDFNDPENAFQHILETIDSRGIRCVIATDDSCVGLASRVAQVYGLPQNKVDAAMLTQRKDLARATLKKAGCRVPDFRVFAIDDHNLNAQTLEYPVVVKPLGLSASRGVIRANNADQFIAACKRIDTILDATEQHGYLRDHLLVEAYLEGDEYAVEGFMISGEFHLLTIFDKPEPLTGPFFEETYYLTPSRLTEARRLDLVDEVRKCCAAYGLEQGPVHAELRLTESGFVLLELAARTIGGQCGQLIEFSLQQKLEELVIQGMCGIKPRLNENAEAAGVLMIPVTSSGILKRVEGLTRAMSVENIKDIEIHIREGYELVPLPEGSSYLGFIFAQAASYEEVYAALKKAHQCLKFVTQPVWQLNPRSDN